MTTHYHSLPVTISVGGDEIEIMADVAFKITAGSPATWEHPGDPAEIEFEKLTFQVPLWDGHKKVTKTIVAPDWLFELITNSSGIKEEICALDWDGPDPDEAYERHRDEKMERAQ